jgi:hypothetical protein
LKYARHITFSPPVTHENFFVRRSAFRTSPFCDHCLEPPAVFALLQSPERLSGLSIDINDIIMTAQAADAEPSKATPGMCGA